ncbi:DNA repair protein RecN [candidate division KSB1 bacterium]|nr:MAG: DNA repair protein RecN [candidate division KSB1 bacterium]
MLRSLYIKNFALFEEIEINFTPGLNVITGETGAGKSLIIDALNSILGDRVDPEMLRSGASKAVIEGVFCSSKLKLDDFFASAQIEDQTDELVLRKELSLSGRSRSFINENLVANQILKELGEMLVDLHGQHEHQSLLKTEKHINYLDAFGDLQLQVAEVTQSYQRIKELAQKLNRLQEQARTLREKHDFLKFQLQEIEQVNPQPDEDLELEREEKLLANSEKLFEYCEHAYQLLYEGEQAIVDKLATVSSLLTELAEIDEQFREQIDVIEATSVNVEEVAKFLQQYRSAIEFNPMRLEEIRLRLSQLAHLRKKFGGPLDFILAEAQRIRDDLTKVENVDEEIEELKLQLDNEKEKFCKLCLKLSRMRQEIAPKLEKAIESVLNSLGMSKARFKVQIEQKEQSDGWVVSDGRTYEATAKGCDFVEFLISPNLGEPLKPLVKIASGGEISRIMLAIKSILAEKDQIPVLVFDEIDIGISGRVAQAVGYRLKELAKTHQIICITHLPQIASLGDVHFAVEKVTHDNRTTTVVKKLTQDERIVEIAKLIGGKKVTEVNLKSAEELLKNT